MADISTTIDYERVRNGVAKINEYANRMESLFGEFDTSMNKALDPEFFKGIAAESVGTDYTVLKNQYGEFLKLVRSFAKEYDDALNRLSTHEQELKNKTSVLNQDLTRM